MEVDRIMSEAFLANCVAESGQVGVVSGPRKCDWTCASKRASVSASASASATASATHRGAAGQPDSPAPGLRSVQGRASRAAPDRRIDTMSKLSETQAVLLSTAAARSDLSVLPAPDTLKVTGAAPQCPT